MKILITILFLFSCLFLNAQNKFALIIANSDYSSKTGWWPLSSSEDVVLVKSALLAQGFNENNIKVVENATRADFRTYFRKYLIEKVGKGDVAFFHYSGHGQQIADDNKDEADGYDEALVGIGAPLSAKQEPGYNGSKHIRDDELGDYLDTLRAALGRKGHVLVTLDACHSGTATRGPGDEKHHTRGTSYKWEFQNALKQNTQTAAKDDWGVNADDNAADLFFIAASSQYQDDDEMPELNCGSLSYAFNAAISPNRIAKGDTYQKLFEGIYNVMSKNVRNRPQYEGNTNLEVLSGSIKGSTVYFAVREVTSDHVVLNGGECNGLFLGTEVAFYSNNIVSYGDTAAAKVLATGTIESAGATWAAVSITDPSKIELLADAHVYVTKASCKGLTVKVKIADPGLKAQLSDVIASNKLTSIVLNDKESELVVEKSKLTNPLGPRYDIYDAYRNRVEINADYNRAIYRIIEYGRATLLKQIDKGHTENVSFTMLKNSNCKGLKDIKDCQYSEIPKSRISDQNIYQLNDSEKVNFCISYKASRLARPIVNYLLFEISPQREIQIVLPNRRVRVTDCQVAIGKTDTVKEYPWVVFPTPLTSGPSQFQLRLLVSNDVFEMNSIMDLFSRQGIEFEAKKYVKTKGGEDRGMGDERSPYERPDIYETSGAVDIYYEITGKDIAINK